MRVALVHDWLVTMGGAERVLEVLAELYPDAPIYTGVVDYRALSPTLQKRKIIPSLVQGWPRATRWYNRYLPGLAYAMEQFDLRAYDVVISSSSAVAKGVLTPAETLHVSYVHTPMRYAWDLYPVYYHEEARGLTRRLMGPVFHYLRLWDRLSADRVDVMVANSHTVQQRIQKHYRRSASVIYPPVAVDRLTVNPVPGRYYLVLSRLVRYKRVDLAVLAANRLREPLVVAGDGPERKALERLAGPTVRFVGRISEPEKIRLMQEAKALIFPGEEDFGIVPVEMQAVGRPVIAFGRGGVLDTVKPGETGWFFAEQSVDAVVEAIKSGDRVNWDPELIRRHALAFGTDRFRDEFSLLMKRALARESPDDRIRLETRVKDGDRG
ncbi:glycosyl transferase group 1 [Sulfobacillus acidophilus TPY]|uniref:Glycosyl transferase group 1 n=1 Tax=Sulfobacillus acidophilus (strain ATCC 700253 / DSM 10332 / NAL) TaxID=679936 RepID=G8TT65_SULAD|nr:glycosyl transferase group 1 [Sulfobacillus acidophilus TPY]AEW06765.1 glycosyl transferase group 1 [Sulfobacillus acidophilus DSM 10332]